MDTDNLIDMANRIGDFFDSMPDYEEAVAGVADHIRLFWEPRMRRALLASLDTSNETSLCQIVREALLGYRVQLTPAGT
jgi:formate dehydrogenase subunit delta